MEIIEYNKEYDEQIKDLLVQLQEYLVKIDNWNTQVLYKDYKEKYFRMDMDKVEKQEGKIYLAEEDKIIYGLIIGVVEPNDEIDQITNNCAKTGSVLELIVSKNSRGKGIGKALLNKIEEYFKSIHCKRITIEVFGPNKNAYNFYYKNGYIDRDIFVSKQLNEEINNCNISTQSYIGKTITAKIDRQMGSKHPKYGFVYPINYGYIPNTISGDGAELDCYILGVFEPIESFTGECIAIIHRLNDNDDKLVLVPENKKYSNGEIRALTEFQERFFESMIIN